MIRERGKILPLLVITITTNIYKQIIWEKENIFNIKLYVYVYNLFLYEKFFTGSTYLKLWILFKIELCNYELWIIDGSEEFQHFIRCIYFSFSGTSDETNWVGFRAMSGFTHYIRNLLNAYRIFLSSKHHSVFLFICVESEIE